MVIKKPLRLILRAFLFLELKKLVAKALYRLDSLDIKL